MDLGCAFSAALGAAERSSAWVVALALLQGGTELRLRATGRSAGAQCWKRERHNGPRISGD